MATGGGRQPTSRTAQAQRTLRPLYIEIPTQHDIAIPTLKQSLGGDLVSVAKLKVLACLYFGQIYLHLTESTNAPPVPPPLRKHPESHQNDGNTGSRACARRAVPKERMSPETCPYLTLSTIVATGHYNTGCRQILLPSAVHLEERLTVSQSVS